MGSSAFQPIEDLAEGAKEKWNDVTSGGPIKRMMSSAKAAMQPKDETKPTAKELGWADQPSRDGAPKNQSAGQRMLKGKGAAPQPKK